MNKPFFSANKSLGQHFLRHKGTIKKIITPITNDYQIILEVGPGPGALTEHLSKLDHPLYLIEKDLRFQDHLATLVPQERIILSDVLKLNTPDLAKKMNLQDEKIWLVSNLPYNVATPIFIFFLQWDQVQAMTLMVQKEVGEKILGLKKEKAHMSSLYALAETFGHVRKLCSVAPKHFTPAPKVDSLVFVWERRTTPSIPLSEFHHFEKFLRNIFQFKRKQLQGILKKKYPTLPIVNILEQLNIQGQTRAENLTIDEIKNLYYKIRC